MFQNFLKIFVGEGIGDALEHLWKSSIFRRIVNNFTPSYTSDVGK